MEKKNKQKIVFFMRHGDRGDRSEEQYEQKRLEKSYDCHLTDLGCIQGQEAGKVIKELIQKCDPNIKKVKLVASPFLRCIMTIENVNKNLQDAFEVQNNEIIIDNYVCELLSLDVLSHCPFTKGLNLRENNTKKYVNMKINDDQKDKNIPKYPEGKSAYDCYDRVFKGFQKVCQEFFDEDNDDTALIISSHGGCCEAILMQYGIYDHFKMYPLTNINGFIFENQEQKQFKQVPKILCKQYDGHLDAADQIYFESKQQQQKQ